MRHTPTIVAWILAGACAALVAGAVSAAKLPESWDGLERRNVKGIDAAYVRLGVVFTVYRNVVIDPVEVAFDKDWKPNRDMRASGRLSADDLQEIKDEMASEFRRIFAEQLAAGGYDVVAKPLDDTLRVSAGLADVYINAPDAMTAGRTRTYTMNAGQMTLVMELRDGPTGQLLARVVDRYVGTETGFAQLTSGVTNSAEFRRAVSAWAKRLVAALDKVSGRAASGA